MEESISRRDPSFRSTELPQEAAPQVTTGSAVDPPVTSLDPVAAATPPSTRGVTTPQLTHPLCTRDTGPEPIRPSSLIPTTTTSPVPTDTSSQPSEPLVSRPATRSKGKTWTDVVRKTDQHTEASKTDGPSFTRPPELYFFSLKTKNDQGFVNYTSYF